MAIEIVHLPIKNGDFPWLCKRLPEGKCNPRGATGDLFCCFQKHNPFGKSQRESKKGENYCPQFLTFVFFF